MVMNHVFVFNHLSVIPVLKFLSISCVFCKLWRTFSCCSLEEYIMTFKTAYQKAVVYLLWLFGSFPGRDFPYFFFHSLLYCTMIHTSVWYWAVW